MIHFDLPKQKSSIIKVIGVGGGGSNAVNFMFSQTVEGVDFIVCNTDAKALEQSKVPNKIQLGPYLTQGLGAGANPEVGKKATEESLEEIRKILEVNTKMAFITVGMGGGTGTGGAPIIAQVCKELGILTVGIVTTPFHFEGPRRLLMAEEGINELKPHVDTLLVISNDKLRMQYGNLKMREAFGKADNVLATAAKCITDVINSRGHIIVDFADVCTVMKNGGVAILGKAEAEGEDRAQLAIEEALASPLLNDNDIKGAKWILININSSEGDDECTMDEIETINNYLRMQAGANTDVIVGMGYDNALEKKIGITLIATGFDSKDPFMKAAVEAKPVQQPEKIVMTLDVNNATPSAPKAPEASAPKAVTERDSLAPTLDVEPSAPSYYSSVNVTMPAAREEKVSSNQDKPMFFELSTPTTTETKVVVKEEKIETIAIDETLQFVFSEKQTETVAISSKPANIYAEAKTDDAQRNTFPKAIENTTPTSQPNAIREDWGGGIAASTTSNFSEPPIVENTIQNGAVGNLDFETISEAEEQRRKLQERVNKLRNLSFNMNNADAADDFETVPAYIRKKMDLFGNAFTSAENFYSKYTVNKDENNKTEISSLNTFLDGKRPD